MIFFILIWSLCSIAFITLASSMSKHQKQIFGHELTVKQTKIATVAGWFLLIFALGLSIANGQKSNMISYWIGVLSFAALFIGLCISYMQTKIRQITIVLAILAVVSFLIHVF